MASQGEHARKAETPWRGASIRGSRGDGDGFADVSRPQPAPKRLRGRHKLSLMEQECGILPEDFEAFMAEQRAQVRARYGLA